MIPLNQTYHCFVAAYEMEGKIVPVVTRTLFFANAPSYSEFYPEPTYQINPPLGGYAIKVHDDGFTDLERKFFRTRGPRFRSKEELYQALEMTFDQPFDDYAQFTAKVEGFSRRERLQVTPLKRVKRPLSDRNLKNQPIDRYTRPRVTLEMRC